MNRRVVLSPLPQTPPSCCAYSRTGDGLPCLHGVAVICHKHGASNVHKFIDDRHLSIHWKALYEGKEFLLPPQHEVDNVILAAKRHVLSGDYLQSPKALAPPRGRPVKNAGVRKRAWYEQGAAQTKKRAYTCSLCHLQGHTRKLCDLRQMFAGDDAGAEDSSEHALSQVIKQERYILTWCKSRRSTYTVNLNRVALKRGVTIQTMHYESKRRGRQFW